MAEKKQKIRRQIGAQIDTQKWARLRAEALIQERPCGHLVEDAIDLYLNREVKKTK